MPARRRSRVSSTSRAWSARSTTWSPTRSATAPPAATFDSRCRRAPTGQRLSFAIRASVFPRATCRTSSSRFGAAATWLVESRAPALAWPMPGISSNSTVARCPSRAHLARAAPSSFASHSHPCQISLARVGCSVMARPVAPPASNSFGNTYLEPGSRSAELYARARAVMPGGNTRTTVFSAPYPAYVASAEGPMVTDVEGQTRLDFVNNYTALIHGHAHPRIVEAVSRQLTLGTAVSFPTETEVRLAELLVDRVDSLERVRFTNSGTEAVMMAVQTARTFSGKTKIARFEGLYHGAYDHAQDVLFPFNDFESVEHSLRQNASELAAVLVDPLPHRPGFIDPLDGFLPRLRQL